MDGAGDNERIDTASPSSTHVEAEAPLRGVGVDRKHVPRHAVAPGANEPTLRRMALPLTLLPWSTRAPDALRTSAPLNFGSSCLGKIERDLTR